MSIKFKAELTPYSSLVGCPLSFPMANHSRLLEKGKHLRKDETLSNRCDCALGGEYVTV